jgi:murein endopeptidase
MIPEEARPLVVRLSREYDWGHECMLGALQKLNVTKVSRQTVMKMLVGPMACHRPCIAPLITDKGAPGKCRKSVSGSTG